MPWAPAPRGSGVARRLLVRLLLALLLLAVPVVAGVIAYYLTTGYLPELVGLHR